MEGVCPFSQELIAPKLLALVDSDVTLLLYLMEEGKGEDGDSWHDTSVFAKTLSRYVSFRDKVLLPGEIRRTQALT